MESSMENINSPSVDAAANWLPEGENRTDLALHNHRSISVEAQPTWPSGEPCASFCQLWWRRAETCP